MWLPGFSVTGKFCWWWNPDCQIEKKIMTLGKVVELLIYTMESRRGAKTCKLEHWCKLGVSGRRVVNQEMFSIQMLSYQDANLTVSQSVRLGCQNLTNQTIKSFCTGAHEARERRKWGDKREEKDLIIPSGKLISIIIFCIFANFWFTDACPESKDLKKICMTTFFSMNMNLILTPCGS